MRLDEPLKTSLVFAAIGLGISLLLFRGTLQQPLDPDELGAVPRTLALFPSTILPASPVLSFVLWCGQRLWGEAPLGFHLLGITVHSLAAGSLVLACLCLGMSRSVSLVAGLLFVANVAHFRAIHALAGFNYPLAMIFVLLALIVLGRFGARLEKRDLVISLLLFLAGIASEPAVLFLLPFIFVGGRLSGRLAAGVMLLFGAASIAMVTLIAAFAPHPAGSSFVHPFIETRWMIAGYLSFWSRLVTTAHWLPVNLNEYNPWESTIGFAAITAALLLSRRCPEPKALAAVWALLATAPLTILSAAFFHGGPAGPSQHLYLATAGSSVLLALAGRRVVGFAAENSPRARQVLAVILVAIVMLVSQATLQELAADRLFRVGKNRCCRDGR